VGEGGQGRGQESGSACEGVQNIGNKARWEHLTGVSAVTVATAKGCRKIGLYSGWEGIYQGSKWAK
jgi:hypothetical protein